MAQATVVVPSRTVEQLIKGMPGAYQGRGRTLYNRGRHDAVIRLQQMLSEDPDPAHFMSIVGAWADDHLDPYLMGDHDSAEDA